VFDLYSAHWIHVLINHIGYVIFLKEKFTEVLVKDVSAFYNYVPILYLVLNSITQ
jgi:hypothetical protein